jgi:ATP-dependent DNA helicase RecG
VTGVLDDPLKRVVGERSAASLSKLGLETTGDLLRHYPRRYSAPGELTEIGKLRIGEHVTVMAQVRHATVRPMRSRGGAMLEAVVTDGNHELQLTFFAKRPGVLRAHEDKLRAGRTGLFTGTVGEYRGRRQLTHPDYLIVGLDTADEDEAIHEASKPIPIYPAAAAVPTWRIARAVRTVLDPLTEADVPDPVPDEVRQREGFPALLDALRSVHAPETVAEAERAQERLRYEEAMVLQTALARRRAARAGLTSVARAARAGGLVDALDAQLPFALTDGQRAAGDEISADLARPTPMLRLLQGDVGAGKTVVALRAMLHVVDAGGQAALLAPTEVLAAQHLATLRELMGPLAMGGMLGGADAATRIVLITGSQGSKERRAALAEAASGAAGIVVGTHALLSETVQFADLGLVVVDEQHRFGVEQRDALRSRGSHPPHTLVMTATPIPRTVAMTVFGDLETTVLRERPAGRAPVETHVVPASNAAWMERVWARVREEVANGRRAYVVCARIDPADVDTEDVADDAPAEPPERAALHSVLDVAQEISTRPGFAGIGVGVMHGRLSSEAKDDAMARFADGRDPVLVATTVIEVGVDVPAATIMVVLDADNFGMSQLHQLRGRVGRSDLPSVCLLVSQAPDGSLAAERLAALASTSDGFELAEKDLLLRREGDVLGVAQSGGRNSLRLLSVVHDGELIASARADADAVVAEDPSLAEHPALAAAIESMLGERETFLEKN